jgi:hypothetical protein
MMQGCHPQPAAMAASERGLSALAMPALALPALVLPALVLPARSGAGRYPEA